MLEERLHHDTDHWYVMLVKMGREAEVKECILSEECTKEIKEIIAPEPYSVFFNDETGENIETRYKHFLGYIFLKTNLSLEKYQTLLSFSSVYRFLGSLEDSKDKKMKYYIPSRIPEEQIKKLKNYLNGYEEENFSSKLKIGSSIEITSGDLASIKGEIISLTDKYATITAKELLGQTVKVPYEKIAVL